MLSNQSKKLTENYRTVQTKKEGLLVLLEVMCPLECIYNGVSIILPLPPIKTDFQTCAAFTSNCTCHLKHGLPDLASAPLKSPLVPRFLYFSWLQPLQTPPHSRTMHACVCIIFSSCIHILKESSFDPPQTSIGPPLKCTITQNCCFENTCTQRRSMISLQGYN